MPSSVAEFDLKKMAHDTTFHLTVRLKNLRWWRVRLWVVSRFAKLVRLILGSKVEIEVEFDYDATD